MKKFLLTMILTIVWSWVTLAQCVPCPSWFDGPNADWKCTKNVLEEQIIDWVEESSSSCSATLSEDGTECYNSDDAVTSSKDCPEWYVGGWWFFWWCTLDESWVDPEVTFNCPEWVVDEWDMCEISNIWRIDEPAIYISGRWHFCENPDLSLEEDRCIWIGEVVETFDPEVSYDCGELILDNRYTFLCYTREFWVSDGGNICPESHQVWPFSISDPLSPFPSKRCYSKVEFDVTNSYSCPEWDLQLWGTCKIIANTIIEINADDCSETSEPAPAPAPAPAAPPPSESDDSWWVSIPDTAPGSVFSTATELEDAIQYLHGEGITRFNTPTTFLANQNIRRDEAATMFYRFADLHDKLWSASGNDCNFPDINQAHSDLIAVVIASCESGLFKWANWRFLPTSNITNAQAITVMGRILEWFLDETWSHWADEYYRTLDSLWVLDGLPMMSKWNYDVPVSRWDIAILLYRVSQWL